MSSSPETTADVDNISLRRVRPDDDAFLFELYRRLREDEMALWGDADQQMALLTMQFSAQRGTYEAQYPNADHDIILSGSVPIGRIMVDRADDAITLVDITLLPERRGSGIGSGLLQELIVEATRRNLPVRLKVVETNPARRLYERLGFASHELDGIHRQMEWRSAEQ